MQQCNFQIRECFRQLSRDLDTDRASANDHDVARLGEMGMHGGDLVGAFGLGACLGLDKRIGIPRTDRNHGVIEVNLLFAALMAGNGHRTVRNCSRPALNKTRTRQEILVRQAGTQRIWLNKETWKGHRDLEVGLRIDERHLHPLSHRESDPMTRDATTNHCQPLRRHMAPSKECS